MQRLRAWVQTYWLIVVVIIALLIFVLLNLNTVRGILTTLLLGDPIWIGAAILLQILFYGVYAVLYHLGFGAVGVASRVVELVPVIFAARVVQVVIPTGGASALAVFVADGVHRKQSGTRTAEGVLLVLLATLVVILPFLIIGLVYLAIATGSLQTYQEFGAIALLIYIVILAGIVFLSRYLPRQLRFLFGVVQAIVSWAVQRFHRQPLPEDWADRQTAAYVSAAESIARDPRKLRLILGVAFILQAIDIASLYAVALAYQTVPNLGAITAAYTLNVAYAVATPVPLGLGVSAGVIALVLSSVGVPAATAGAIAVVYRGLNAWLPLLVGVFFLSRVPGLRGGPPRQEQARPPSSSQPRSQRRGKEQAHRQERQENRDTPHQRHPQ